MDKKELKFYEVPACEVVELKIQGMLCASPVNGGDGQPGGGTDLDEDEDLV